MSNIASSPFNLNLYAAEFSGFKKFITLFKLIKRKKPRSNFQKKIYISKIIKSNNKFFNKDAKVVIRKIGELNGYEGYINAIEFSPFRKNILASAGNGGILTLWDINTKKQLCSIDSKSEALASIAFSKFQENILATGSEFELNHFFAIRIWKINKNQQNKFHSFQNRSILLRGHTKSVNSLEFSPFKPYILVSGSSDKTIRIWNIKTKCQIKVFRNNNQVNSIGFSPFEPDVFVSGTLKTITFWNIEKKSKLKTFKYPGSAPLAYSVKFSPFNPNHLVCSESRVIFARTTNCLISKNKSIVHWNIRPIIYNVRFLKIKNILISFLLCIHKLKLYHFESNNIKILLLRFLIEQF